MNLNISGVLKATEKQLYANEASTEEVSGTPQTFNLG